MRYSIRMTVLLVFIVAAILAGQSFVVHSAEPDQKEGRIEASVDEIDKNLILIGRLKKPLGTLMTVRGKWSYPNSHNVKDYSLQFTVSQVDGHKIEKPIEYNLEQLDFFTEHGTNSIPPRERHKELVGKEWTLRAYETGSIELIPEDFWKDGVPYALPYYFDTFTSKLTGVLAPNSPSSEISVDQPWLQARSIATEAGYKLRDASQLAMVPTPDGFYINMPDDLGLLVFRNPKSDRVDSMQWVENWPGPKEDRVYHEVQSYNVPPTKSNAR